MSKTMIPAAPALAAAVAVALGAGAAIAAGPAVRAGAPAAGQENPIEASEDSIAAGRRVYGRFCRSCHGMQGDGRGMAAPAGSQPANLIDDEWDHGSADADLYTVIREGVPPKYDMDAWEGRITDEEIWHVINFLRDLASND